MTRRTDRRIYKQLVLAAPSGATKRTRKRTYRNVYIIWSTGDGPWLVYRRGLLLLRAETYEEALRAIDRIRCEASPAAEPPARPS